MMLSLPNHCYSLSVDEVQNTVMEYIGLSILLSVPFSFGTHHDGEKVTKVSFDGEFSSHKYTVQIF